MLPSRTTSGLVEMQRIFVKGHPKSVSRANPMRTRKACRAEPTASPDRDLNIARKRLKEVLHV